MSAGLGTMALPEGDRVDFARLRAERRRRLLDAMAGHGLDALVLGRPANMLYASGARQLWVAGARPFGPGAIVIAEPPQVRLLSTWDEGVPDEIPHEHLFGLSWNPAVIARNLRAIPELGGARRIGTDSSTPGFTQFLTGAAPGAEVVDAGPALEGARGVKTADELACIETAVALAEGALAALDHAACPGVPERELVGIYVEWLAAHGVQTPPSEDVVVRLDDPPAFDVGAMYAGYEGAVGRTRGAPPGLLDAVIARCTPGTTGAQLLAAADGDIRAYGLGLGVEPPVIGPGIGHDAVLHDGQVLSVARTTPDGWFQRDTVVVGPAPRVLTRG